MSDEPADTGHRRAIQRAVEETIAEEYPRMQLNDSLAFRVGEERFSFTKTGRAGEREAFLLRVATLLVVIVASAYVTTERESGYPTTPKAAERLLLLVSPSDRAEAIVGDLEEIFAKIALRHGVRFAAIWYWWQALRSSFHLVLRQVARLLALHFIHSLTR